MGLYLCACNDAFLSTSSSFCVHTCECVYLWECLFVRCLLNPLTKSIRFGVFLLPYKNTFEDVVIKIFIWKWSFSLFYYVKIETGYLHSETCLDGPGRTNTRSQIYVFCIYIDGFGSIFSDFRKIVEMKCVVQFAVKIVHINFID